MAGCSGSPLSKKLGIGEGTRFAVKSHPPDFAAALGPLPPTAEWLGRHKVCAIDETWSGLRFALRRELCGR